jgi:hypothetical protein
MDSQRAREVLLLYRPDSSDTNDPQVQEALDQVKLDPELREWFDAHCSRQALVRDQFRRIAVPGNLRQRILDEVGKPRIVALWERPAFQALAAAAAIALFVGAIYFRGRTGEKSNFAAYRNRVVSQTQRMYPRMDMVGTNLTELSQYLASRQWPADYVLPRSMEKLAAIGCAALQWRTNNVTLVCFDSGKKSDLYLFVIDQAPLPDPPPLDQPQFARIGKLMSASWSHAGRAYILASPGDERFLRRFLE